MIKFHKSTTFAIIITVISCIIVGSIIQDQKRIGEELAQKDITTRQKHLIDLYKEKKGNYPDTSSYNEVQAIVIKEFNEWSQNSDQKWITSYKKTEDGYLLTTKKGNTTIICTNNNALCATTHGKIKE